jgi:hypothetical protein
MYGFNPYNLKNTPLCARTRPMPCDAEQKEHAPMRAHTPYAV